jgi:hypothetical protein
MEHRKEQGSKVVRRQFGHIAVGGLVVMTSALLCAMPVRRARAQSTSASIHGQAPAGDVVVATSTTGFRRHTKVKANGKYAFRSLPLGTYRVKLMKDGKVLDMYHHVPLMVSGTRIVNFACPHDKCAAQDDSSS